MSNETIGLTVKIDGDIAKGKAKVDELADYARRQLGGAMFSGQSTGAGGFAQGFTSQFEKVKRESKSAFDSIINDAKKMREELSAAIAGGVKIEGREIDQLQRQVESLRTSFGQTYKASANGAKDASREVESFRRQINALERDMNRLSNAEKANAFQKYGMFNNKGISPLFTAQQIVEDFSYAGMRGAANNIAFLLAELAPAGGLGAKLAGGGILALMTYQFYEMGKSMEWWGTKADTAAQKASKMKSAIESAASAASGVQSAMATAQSNLQSGALSLPLNQRGSAYADMRRQALLRVMSSPTGVNALRGAISSNPAGFAFGSVGGSLRNQAQVASAQANMAAIQQARNVVSLMAQTRKSAVSDETTGGWLLKNLMPFPNMFVGSREYSAASQDQGRQQLRGLLGRLPGGASMTGLIDQMGAGHLDYGKIEDALKEQYNQAKDSLSKLRSEHNQAMKEMKESSGAAAAEVLNLAQNNNRAADAVLGVVEGNRALNEQYQKQMALLKNLEVLKERDQFRSTAFSLMRSKGAQFMEEAGMPQWMIERRNMALYERQASLLAGSAQASGAAGDTRGQIEYLKQIQQLQFEVIGNTNNRGLAERVMERAIGVQHEIEALIRSNQQKGQAEYEMVQQLTAGLVQMRDIINAMPPIRLGALQQAGEVAQLNAQLAALRNNAATVQPLTGVAASVAKFGEMPMPGFKKGGHIPGYGGGDKVPAMLERGEFIINKDAVRALGVETLYDLNSAGVRKFAKGGWSGTGYASVHSSYPGSQRRLRQLRQGQSWYRDFRSPSASSWARRGVRDYRDSEFAANQSERAWMAMTGRAAGQIGNWGTFGDTGIVASLGEPGAPFGTGFASVASGSPASAVPAMAGSPVINWGGVIFHRDGGRIVNNQYGLMGGGWMQMRMAQRQATAGLMSERARQAQAAGAASRLRYTRQLANLSAAGASRRAAGSFFASRNGMSPQQVAAMRASRFAGGRWGSNFAAYTGQLFGGGFNPYMGGGFGGFGMQAPQMARSYGLWDNGPAFMGLRAFSRGGYVSAQGGRLIASGPDIFQGDTEFEYMGGYPAGGPDFNYQSFMDQRNRVLAGSLNAAYGGPTDMAGNTLGSFGSFSDGTLRSRFSGGFSSVGRGQGFGSGMRGSGFSSFRRPIGAMTGGYVTSAGNVARHASGSKGGSSGTNVSNNFGSIRIEVKSPKDAADTSYQLRRTRASYWAQKG